MLTEGQRVDTQVLALVVPNSSRSKDATNYERYNNCKKVDGNDLFKSLIAHKDARACECQAVVEKHGFVVEFRQSTAPDGDTLTAGIKGAAKLLTCYKKFPVQFEDALRLLRGVYGPKASDVPEDYLKGEIVTGVARFLKGQFGSIESIIANLARNPLDLYAMWKQVQDAPYSDSRPVRLATLISEAYSLILNGRKCPWTSQANRKAA